MRRKHTSPNLSAVLQFQREAEHLARVAKSDSVTGRVDPSSSSSLSLVPRRAKLLILALLQLIRRCCDRESESEIMGGSGPGASGASPEGTGRGPIRPIAPASESAATTQSHTDPAFLDNNGGGSTHTDRVTGLVAVNGTAARSSRGLYRQNVTVRQLSIGSADSLLLLADYAMAIHDGGLANAIIRSVRRDVLPSSTTKGGVPGTTSIDAETGVPGVAAHGYHTGEEGQG